MDTNEYVKQLIKENKIVPVELFMKVADEYSKKLKEFKESNECKKQKHKILPIYFSEDEDALKVTQFPAGEPNIEIDYNFIIENNIVTLNVIYPYNPVVLDAMFVVLDVIKNTKTKVIIDIPYLPYSRADRNIKVDGKDRIPMVKKFLDRLFNEYDDIIVEVNTDSIHCIDVLQYYKKLKNREEIFDYIDSSKYDYIIFPDFGMHKRFNAFYDKYEIGKSSKLREKIVIFDKKREDGSVAVVKSELNFPNFDFEVLRNKRCIIVDDIIDGGATIEEVAKVLKDYTDDIDAFTVHGLFSSTKGLKLDNIKNVSCIYSHFDNK